jgi:hypothetical protein
VIAEIATTAGNSGIEGDGLKLELKLGLGVVFCEVTEGLGDVEGLGEGEGVGFDVGVGVGGGVGVGVGVGGEVVGLGVGARATS